MSVINLREFVSQDDIAATPKSNWYQFTLGCEHKVLSRVRLSFRASFNEHFVRCPQRHSEYVTEWVPLVSVEAVTDEFVRNVLDGSSFIVPRRILRTDGEGTSTGTPFPYITRDSDI
jgi:hypothetical protein